MISSLVWVEPAKLDENPTTYKFTQEEYEKIQKMTQMEVDEAKRDLKEHINGAKLDKNGLPIINFDEDPDLKEYNFKDYDKENQDSEEGQVGIFGKLPVEEEEELMSDDEDTKSEAEELRILPTDHVLLATKTEDEISHLGVYVYEHAEDNLYMHHDIMLPAFPLCTTFLDFQMGERAKENGIGSMVAIGTMDPQIEIWDLNVYNPIYPTAVLGKKIKKKSKPNSEYHVNAVMSLSWNQHYRNYLVSSSADTTVKVWDLNTSSCIQSYNHHEDKVQSVQFHPTESNILLTGGYDKKVAVFDGRAPENLAIWNLSGDVECLKWDPTTSHQFFVSTEHGIVQCYDIRNTQSQQPIFTLHAHDEAVTSFDIHPTIANCLVTCSTDKLIKIWDYKNNQPSMVLSRNFDLGQLFSVSFNKHQPTALVMGGSKGEPTVWEFGTNHGVRRCFKDRMHSFNTEVQEKKVVSLVDDNEDSENEEGPAFEGQEEEDDDMMDTS